MSTAVRLQPVSIRVLLTEPGASCKITNLTGSSPLWFTVSFPGGPCPIPTVGGSGCYCAASVAGGNTSVRTAAQFGTVVQLISAAPTTYMIEVQSSHATS